MSTPERCGIAEVIVMTSLSRRRIQEMAASGEIPSAAKLGGKDWTFNRVRVRRWIEAKERECLKISTSGTAFGTRASRSAAETYVEAYERDLYGKPGKSATG